jgi:alcohol dehydrogenase class IV
MTSGIKRPLTHVASPMMAMAPGAVVAWANALPALTRVLVVTDATVLPLLAEILAALGDRTVVVRSDVVADGDVAMVEATATVVVAERIDTVLGVGGGSVIDTAKAIGAVASTGATLLALEGLGKVSPALLTSTRVKVAVVAAPTTTGTGSEATQFAVIKDVARKHKLILVDPALVPSRALLDPTLAMSLPLAVVRATAVDALSHALEALCSRAAHAVGTALALEAARILLVEQPLAKTTADPANLQARADALLAAHVAGMAVSTSYLGGCHALAHALGARCGVVHGVANGVFLLPVLRHAGVAVDIPLTRLALTIGVPDVEALLSFIDTFVHETAAVPRRLSALGVTADDVAGIVEEARIDPDLATHPIKLDAAALRAIVESIL